MVKEKVTLVARSVRKVLEAIVKKKTTDVLFASIVAKRAINSIKDTSFIAVGN